MTTAEIPVRPPQAPARGRRAFVADIMGMPISVHVRAADPMRTDIAHAVDNALAHLRRVDRVFSTWRADSDLLRLQHGEDIESHEWLAEVVELCLAAEDRTEGLFGAWRARHGRTVFDPTGLVKGWAVSGAAEHLRLVPEIAFAIGAGGDIATGVGRGLIGRSPVWRIGIEDPRHRGRIVDVVSLTEGAVATSGTAIRGAHIIDPATGESVERPGSATVVGPDLLWADVWATAAFVDPTRTARLLGERDAAYRMITH